MPTSLPSTGEEPKAEGPGRSHWLLSLLLALVGLAVVASGWGVAKMTLDGGQPDPAVEDSPPQTRPPLIRAVDADPTDPEEFLELAAQELRAAPSFHISYTQSVEGRGIAHGWARHEPDSDTAFEHYFKTDSGVRVYRYDLPGTGFIMSAEKGLPGMTVLDSPSEADRRLCSVEFVLGPLDELTGSAADLEMTGTEEIELPEGSRGVQASTHTTHRYTGTFQTLAGDYQPDTGRNTLTRIAEAEFELWVDEDGHPRRLSYTSPEGFGETYDYHPLTT
ncbi:hypothetical protein [Nocardiopsis exhalans]|uniref:hypothetical protein n=1 Tax=Nocardiopsis exhalans TaxID=163604 RepID=UPI0031D9BBA4